MSNKKKVTYNNKEYFLPDDYFELVEDEAIDVLVYFMDIPTQKKYYLDDNVSKNSKCHWILTEVFDELSDLGIDMTDYDDVFNDDRINAMLSKLLDELKEEDRVGNI